MSHIDVDGTILEPEVVETYDVDLINYSLYLMVVIAVYKFIKSLRF